jgi:multisubunit Na+/H+ antiporter MnhC subunit
MPGAKNWKNPKEQKIKSPEITHLPHSMKRHEKALATIFLILTAIVIGVILACLLLQSETIRRWIPTNELPGF